MRIIRQYFGITVCYALSLVLLVACAKAPYTERSQFILLSAEQELHLGSNSAKDILKKEKTVSKGEQADSVRRVGKRIAAVADRPDFDWEFHTIEKDDVPNAFCLPGGKIFVYTGLFEYAKDDEELAAVIGHEVGHAIARHGAERMSTALAVQAGAAAGMLALSTQGASRDTMNLAAKAFGIGASVGIILPFSRSQESEADHIGLILMAKAGYSPHAALTFWDRFAKQPGKKPPEFLSTHPASEKRIEAIKELLPKALEIYEQQGKSVDS